MSRLPRSLRAMLRSIRDDRGASLVEFALSIPIMLLLYTAGVQISDAISCNRKVTITARSMVDLVAQNTTGATSDTEVATDLAAAEQVMAPYDASKAVIRITEVYTKNALGNTKVVWSKATDGSGYKKNKNITVPTSFKGADTYYLLAEVVYSYQPPASFGIVGPLTLHDSIYMVPRNTDQIDCSDCTR